MSVSAILTGIHTVTIIAWSLNKIIWLPQGMQLLQANLDHDQQGFVTQATDHRLQRVLHYWLSPGIYSQQLKKTIRAVNI